MFYMINLMGIIAMLFHKVDSNLPPISRFFYFYGGNLNIHFHKASSNLPPLALLVDKGLFVTAPLK